MSEEKKENEGEQGKEKEKDPAPKITALEWVVAILSAAAFAAIVAMLLFEQSRQDRPFPIVTAKITRVEKESTNFVAMAEVRNDGDKTASRLECTAEVVRDGKAVESRMARVEFLPPHSSKRVGFVFGDEARAGELRVRLGGFEER
jgi:uncharacterized protein (TIGR02588 family)